MKSVTLLLGALFLPSAAFFPAVMASEPAGTEQEAVGVVTQGVVVVPRPATGTVRGVVDSFDEGSDTIKLRLSPETTQQFKVQDGLVFNAVRFGDQVEVSVQDIAGAKTIVGLKKQ